MSDFVTWLLIIGASGGLSLTLFLAAIGLVTYAWSNKLAGIKRIIVALGLTALAQIVCCSAAVILPYSMHNFMLFRLEQSLYRYPFPPNTRLVSRQSTIRPNTGNGDWCMFRVRQTMVTTLTENDISSYYSDAEVASISEDANLIWVHFSEAQPQADKIQFAIEINDMTESFFDFRCYQ